MNALSELEALLTRIERAADSTAPAGDAIEEVLGGTARTSGVRRLRDAAVMQRFRAELAAGQVQLETVRGFLDVLGQVLTTVLAQGR